MHSLSTTLLIVLVLLVGIASTAHGQGRPARSEAVLLYQEAKDRFEHGEFEASIEKLDAAYRLVPDSNILVKKAQCHEKLLEPEEALENYEQALHLHSQGMRLTRVLRAKVETAIKALQAELERPVRVSILCNVPGAEILIDGRLHIAPVVTDLPRGDHKVAASAKGWVPLPPQPLRVKGAGEQSLFLTLKELSGRYVVRSRTDAPPREVRVDGAALPETAWTAGRQQIPVEARVGRHEVVCVYEQGAAWAEFTILKDLTVEVDCPAAPVTRAPAPRARGRIWKPLLMAAGVGMLAASGVFLAGYVEAQDLPDRCGVSVRTNKLSWGAGLGGAGLAVTGAATYLLFFRE